MQPIKVRKKPVTVEAMQFGPGGIAQFNAMEWVKSAGGEIYAYDWNVREVDTQFPDGAYWQWSRASIKTLEGTICAFSGDWIIRGVQGEFYPCKPDIFAATYEEVSE